jgi:hypothetical protein
MLEVNLHNSIPKGCCVQRNSNVPFAGFDPRATAQSNRKKVDHHGNSDWFRSIELLHFRASNHNAERVNELLSYIQDCDHQHSSYLTTPKPQRRKFDIPKGRLLLRAANANHRQLKNLEDGLWFSFFKRVSKFVLFQWYKLKNNNAKKNHENKEQNSAKAKNLAQYANEGLQKIM